MSDAREPVPDDAGYQSPAEQRQPDRGEVAGAEAVPDDGLLELVLQHTAQVSGADAELSPQTMERFRDLARQHRGQVLKADPIVRDLVETILRDTFAALEQPDSFWRSTALSIAHTLMEDPHTQQRLNSFWLRLSEAM